MMRRALVTTILMLATVAPAMMALSV